MVNKRKKKRNDGKYFEKKTHNIISKLNPDKQVLPDVRIRGKLSESSRQLDVILRDPDEYDFIAFECKDEKTVIGTPTVEGYNTKLLDVGAKKGAIVSNTTFSRGARRMADKLKIDLLQIVDTGDEAIKTKLLAPSGLVNERVDTWSIVFKGDLPDEIKVNNPDLSNLEVVLCDGKKANIKEIVCSIWDDLGDSVEQGTETREFDNLKIELNNKTITIPTLIISLNINFQYRIGIMDITQSEGIYNVKDGSYQTSSMAVGPFGQEIFNTWNIVTKDELYSSKLTAILHTRTDIMASNLN